jgi:hypothetical protein
MPADLLGNARKAGLGFLPYADDGRSGALGVGRGIINPLGLKSHAISDFISDRVQPASIH